MSLPAPILSQIVARSKNGVIGADGDLPWHLPDDLKTFKAITMGKPCVMGRRTWESLPFPLPGRANYVLTGQRGYPAKGARVFHDLHTMVSEAHVAAGLSGAGEVMVIGGAGVYRQTLPFCQRLYITEVDIEIAGDTHYPDLGAGWTRVRIGPVEQGPRDDHAWRVNVYERGA